MSHLDKKKFLKDLKTQKEISKAEEIFVNFKLLQELFQDYIKETCKESGTEFK